MNEVKPVRGSQKLMLATCGYRRPLTPDVGPVRLFFLAALWTGIALVAGLSPAKAQESETVEEAEKKDEAEKEDAAGKEASGDEKAEKPGVLELLEKKKAEKEDAEKQNAAGKQNAAEKAAAEKKAEEKKKLQQAVEGLPPEVQKQIAEALGGGRATTVVKVSAGEEEEGEEEGGEDDSPAGDAAGEKKEPAPPMFWMRDGTRLAGYPRLDQLHVETAYGNLTIPVREVTRVRFASVQSKDFSESVRKLIQELGHEEFDLRERAMEELRKVGTPALELLKDALDSEDEEIKSRAEILVGELEEEVEEPEDDEIHTVPIKGDEDEVVTLQFTVMGRVLEDSFDVETRYGELTFHRQDIISIVFQEPLVTRQTITVPGTSIAGKNQWLDTGVDVEKGEAFELAASGSITMPRYGNTSCGPEGTTNIGSRFENLPAGALVGKVGDGGKPFLVGSSYQGKAEEAGRLKLAIALQSSDAQGSFEVELEKENKSARKTAAERASAAAVNATPDGAAVEIELTEEQ